MFIEIIDKVDHYEEAIKISCDILEKAGVVESRYYEAILDKIAEFGSYFCLGDGVCMPHARPEEGVLKEGLCIVKLNTPIDFDGKPINVFFTVAAKDGDSHLSMIRKIAEVSMDSDKLNQIKNAKTKEEIMEVM